MNFINSYYYWTYGMKFIYLWNKVSQLFWWFYKCLLYMWRIHNYTLLHNLYINNKGTNSLLTPWCTILLQDLMTKNKQRYRWRLLICGIVIIVVLALVIAAAILLTGRPDSAASRTNSAPGISLEEWLSGSLSSKSFNGTWISGKYHSFCFFSCAAQISFGFLYCVKSTPQLHHPLQILFLADSTFEMSSLSASRSRRLINPLFKRIEAHRANNAQFNALSAAGYMEEVRF